MLGQLFQSSHTSKLQDQFRVGLQLKGDLGWDEGWPMWGWGWGTEDKTRLQALVEY